jgi:hypothetical protein
MLSLPAISKKFGRELALSGVNIKKALAEAQRVTWYASRVRKMTAGMVLAICIREKRREKNSMRRRYTREDERL